ncbi:hypothetical protein A3755_16960 [Oleiphilus sp. HI0085]|uniref:hypothetical protein n=1 Tax=Oleiphilus sp. HI0132 TaxID=1822270 RepID=UPI0007C25935|nr:hypothetical protein [Oleiphilus sp. HI0132]KZY81130.1 hypothetical protein A3741_17730 [Oleiphilus sp. HI0069]KZY83935.1 hypothetical protein A3741_16510 [Oleiphilus sp. HI0069]KZZ47047.1 hypothetical protein A3755_16960 [Oleiphilus sp. HI0085]KZZ73575.1 hypothetical protein A3766_19890 [Oleiphilus sp. HI0132]
MKTKCVLVMSLLPFLFVPTESVAKRGFGSLFQAGRGVSAINGVKKYDVNTLTAIQLKQCLNLEAKIEASEITLSKGRIPIASKEQTLTSIEADLESLDRYMKLNKKTEFNKQIEVDAFNAEVKRYNRLISVYKTEFEVFRKLQTSYNNKVDDQNALIKRFKVECAGKRYYENDFAAIKKGMK